MARRADFGERAEEALAGPIISLLATTFGTVLSQMQSETPQPESWSFSTDLVIGILNSYPGILAIIGILTAIWIAQLIGLVGAILELLGASMFFNNPSASIVIIFIGVGLVVMGSYIPQGRFLESMLNGKSNGRHRRR